MSDTLVISGVDFSDCICINNDVLGTDFRRTDIGRNGCVARESVGKEALVVARFTDVPDDEVSDFLATPHPSEHYRVDWAQDGMVLRAVAPQHVAVLPRDPSEGDTIALYLKGVQMRDAEDDE